MELREIKAVTDSIKADAFKRPMRAEDLELICYVTDQVYKRCEEREKWTVQPANMSSAENASAVNQSTTEHRLRTTCVRSGLRGKIFRIFSNKN